jgi:hypothetical protein
MAPLRVGDVLYGFCGGRFGHDSYDDKRVEAIGADWVVAREDSGQAVFHHGDPELLTEYRHGDASDEDRIRDAMAEATDHPDRVVTR